jgi:uncharacterized protein YbjT (DUF2867 family)
VLCKLLIKDDWRVVGTTRSPAKAAELRSLDVEPTIVDVFDRDALIQAVCAARPEVVVHQLTDLPKEFSSANLAARTQCPDSRGRHKNLIAAATWRSQRS